MALKFLLCDDEIDTHLFVEAALEKYKVKLIDAWNGKQAVEIVKSERPDLIIMDFNMPDMNGFNALVEISKVSPGIPAVMLTGLNLDPGIKQDLDKYITEYLVKPFDRKELISAIKKVFEDFKE